MNGEADEENRELPNEKIEKEIGINRASCRRYYTLADTVVLPSIVLFVAKGFRVYAEKTFIVFRSWLGKVEGGKI